MFQWISLKKRSKVRQTGIRIVENVVERWREFKSMSLAGPCWSLNS